MSLAGDTVLLLSHVLFALFSSRLFVSGDRVFLVEDVVSGAV